MIVAVGIDVVECARFERWRSAYAEELDLVFTASELEACSRAQRSALMLAFCFAGKEAAAKALGTGFHALHWRDIEVVPGLCDDTRSATLDVRLSLPARLQGRPLGCERLSGACMLVAAHVVAIVLGTTQMGAA